MNSLRKDRETSDLLPSVMGADVNLSRLPFFALVRAELKDFEVELTVTDTRDNKRLELFWGVTPNIKYGYPGLFAKKVHRAIEYMLTRNGIPVPEYLDFSFYEIIKLLGLDDGGKTRAEIKQAILSITSALIESKGTFCYLDNGEKRWVEDYFHLYERVVFAGKELPDRTIAEKHRIYFNQWYLMSLNSLYLKPFDFNYWNSLKKNIAGRLYEYLSFISFATKCKSFSIEYHRLCAFLPITPQKYFSKAKQVLSRAHQELIKTGFLKKVAWRKSKTDEKKWIITYYFGIRAKSELKRGFKDDTYRPALLAVETADIEEIEELIEPEEKEQEVKPACRDASFCLVNGTGERGAGRPKKQKQAKEEETLSPIAQELINRGITKSVAIDFYESFPEEHLVEKIEMHDYKKETGELRTNAAGWLREAIARDYKLSEEQLKRQAQLKEKHAWQQEQRILEEKAKEIQEQRLKKALIDFPPDEQWVKERVMEHVNVREMTIKVTGSEPFTQEEIRNMYLDFSSQIPKTDEEKRAWLISNYSEYALSTIISELTQQEQQQSQQVEHPDEIGEEFKENVENPDIIGADERFPCNSVEDVLGEVVRQMAEFEANHQQSENGN
ncbi:MAG: hypothetical protein ACE5GN_04115 [Waddliaceae bacterium]